MTTIVLHDGVISVDSQLTAGDRKYSGNKCERHADALYFLCGNASNARQAVAAWVAGEDELHVADCTIIKVHNGELWCVAEDGGYKPEGTHVWGSGGDAALAAVYCGKDSRAACEIATRVDLYSGGPVRSFRVETGEEL